MSFYHITDLEQLSGIKAHTIRIWEKRYNFFEPHRTDTNIRMYDDKQVIKLLNASTLLANGYKISHIADLSENQICNEVNALFTKKQTAEAIDTTLINNLIKAVITFDEPSMEKWYSETVAKYGVYDGMLKVLYPLLVKVGLMWVTQNILPIQEHFCSTFIRRKLSAEIDRLPVANKFDKLFLLMLPPDEWHEIALIFTDYIIRSNGYETINLSQNVPIENIPIVYEHRKFTHIIAYFTTRKDEVDYQNFRENLKVKPGVKLYVAGNQDVKNTLESQKNTFRLDSPHDVLKILK